MITKTKQACVLYPQNWTDMRIRASVYRLECAGYSVSYSIGATDGVCVDCDDIDDVDAYSIAVRT